MTLKENVASIFIIIKFMATIVYPPMVDTHHYEENETEKKLFSAFFTLSLSSWLMGVLFV